MIKSRTLYKSEIEQIIESKNTHAELAEQYGVSKWTIAKVKAGQIEGMDENFSDDSIKLSYSLQRTRENSQRSRKVARETFRIADLIQSSHNALIDVLNESKIAVFDSKKHNVKTDEGENVVGVIQLSDLHFGERVDEVWGNEYNLEVAAKRLNKLANKAMKIFEANDVTEVFIACTGDFINSDRRLDEIVSNVNTRAKNVFSAVEILKQMILHLNTKFNVTVGTVCGNESRIRDDLGWVDFMAFDSFDAIIHFFLEYIFKDKEGVTILPMTDPLEKVIDVNGHHICLIHGHNGIANDAAMENKVARLIQKYAAQQIRIDYTLFGHIHCTRISDLYARSASLVGANAYSDKALTFTSRAAQNIYLVSKDSINGMRIDLQEYKKYDAYDFDKNNDVYVKPKSASTVVIQKVLK